MATISISGVYECGYEYTRLTEVPEPRPGQPIEKWWDDVVWQETGNHHYEDEGNCTTAVVLASIDPLLVDTEFEWVTG